MIRGTSAPFTFKMPIKGSEVADVEIKFWQRNNSGTSDIPLPIKITKDDWGGARLILNNNSNELGIILAPEQTLVFSEKRKASVQGIITDTDGFKYGIKETLIDVDPLYKDSEATSSDEDDSIVILDGSTI